MSDDAASTRPQRPSLRERIDGQVFFWLYFVSYTVVHLIFEYKFWAQGSGAIWAKYDVGDSPVESLRIAEQVYYTKATWFFILVWLQALKLRFQDALAWSFFVYSLELVLFFPFQVYTLLNLGLALGMVVEVLILRRRRRSQ